MGPSGFRAYLKERDLPEERIARFLPIAGRFQDFVDASQGLGSNRPPGADDVQAFAELLIWEGHNTEENFLGLAHYCRFVGSDPAYVAVVEILDGSEALEQLRQKLGEMIGEGKRDVIFDGVSMPPLGTSPAERPPITQTVLQRMEAELTMEECRRILSSGLRALPTAPFLPDREKYLESENIDAFLERRREGHIAHLEQLMREKKLYHTQEITPEVVEFVRKHPEVAGGVRRGDRLYETKIPYMTKEYLSATDDRERSYFYCHCPWVRDSLRRGDVEVSPIICHCSSAFHRRYWEVVLGQPLESDVVESVLRGDPWCRFAIRLPDRCLPADERVA